MIAVTSADYVVKTIQLYGKNYPDVRSCKFKSIINAVAPIKNGNEKNVLVSCIDSSLTEIIFRGDTLTKRRYEDAIYG